MDNKTQSAPYDPVDYLKTPESITEYLNAAIEDGDERLMRTVVKDVVRAVAGMSELSRQTGLSRESLYRALWDDGNPRLSNFVTVLHALNLELAVRPRKDVA